MVSDIDDERVGNGPDADPLAVGPPLDLEAADVVLGNDDQGARVPVAADAEGEVRGGAGRVVVEPHKAGLFLEVSI